MVAIFQMLCCNRLFVWGRYSGNQDSTSGFYPKAFCTVCKIPLPRINMQKSTVKFVGYMSDDRLDSPYHPMKRRYLSEQEYKKFKLTEPECPDYIATPPALLISRIQKQQREEHA